MVASFSDPRVLPARVWEAFLLHLGLSEDLSRRVDDSAVLSRDLTCVVVAYVDPAAATARQLRWLREARGRHALHCAWALVGAVIASLALHLL